MKLSSPVYLMLSLVFLSVGSAQATSRQDLRHELQRSVCLNDWDAAVTLIQPLISSTEITESDRQYYLQMRRQIQDYRAGGVRLNMDQVPACQEFLEAASAPQETTAAPPQGRSLDWAGAAASIQQRSHPTPRSTPSANVATRGDRQDQVAFIGDGEGGNSQYQLWRNWNGSEYYLFIWQRGASASQAPAYSYAFASSRQALDFFDCQFAGRNLSSCGSTDHSPSFAGNLPDCGLPWQRASSDNQCD